MLNTHAEVPDITLGRVHTYQALIGKAGLLCSDAGTSPVPRKPASWLPPRSSHLWQHHPRSSVLFLCRFTARVVLLILSILESDIISASSYTSRGSLRDRPSLDRYRQVDVRKLFVVVREVTGYICRMSPLEDNLSRNLHRTTKPRAGGVTAGSTYLLYLLVSQPRRHAMLRSCRPMWPCDLHLHHLQLHRNNDLLALLG